MSQVSRAAAAASKARRNFAPIVLGTFSVFDQATSFPSEWDIQEPGPTTGRTAQNLVNSQASSAIATIGRGSGSGIRQFEFEFLAYSGGASVLWGIAKAGREAEAAGQGTIIPTTDDGFAVLDGNGLCYHGSSGDSSGSSVAVPPAVGDKYGIILDTNPSDYKLYTYKGNTAPVLRYSTVSGGTANADLTGTYYPVFSATFTGGAALSTIVRLNTGQEAFVRFFSGAVAWSA